MDKFTRQDIQIKSAGQNMAAWLYVPTGLAPREKRPAIVMAHGWTAVKEMYLDDYAARFADDGFVVAVFDYRNFATSEGEPRQHIDPAMQHEDYKNAITWIQLQPMVNPGQIGIWGSSFSGAHVLHLGAFDRRVKAVVAQVPLVNGIANFRRLVRNDNWPATHAWFAADRAEQYRSGKLGYLPVVAEEGQPSALPTRDAYEWLTEIGRTRAPSWKNEQTVRSLELALEYNPGAGIHLISPTPLLMIVAKDDVLTPCDLAIEAYSRALEPKKLEIIPGGHFDAYTVEFARSSALASNWFTQHLMQ